MNIIWNIIRCEHDVKSGGIIKVEWAATIKDNANSFSSCGHAFLFPNPESQDFLPYEQVTENVVLGWVGEQVDKEKVEAYLVEQIEAQKNPVTVSGVPWPTKKLIENEIND